MPTVIIITTQDVNGLEVGYLEDRDALIENWIGSAEPTISDEVVVELCGSLDEIDRFNVTGSPEDHLRDSLSVRGGKLDLLWSFLTQTTIAEIADIKATLGVDRVISYHLDDLADDLSDLG